MENTEKVITVYPCSIRVFEDATLTELQSLGCFMDLIEDNISSAYAIPICDKDKNISYEFLPNVVVNDIDDEWLFEKSHLKIITKAIQNTNRSAYCMEDFHIRLKKLCETDRLLVLKILRVARKLGVEQDRTMGILDETLEYIKSRGKKIC